MNMIVNSLASVMVRHTLLRRLIILAWHVLGTCLTYCLAFYLRFDGVIPPDRLPILWRTLPLLLFVNLSVFFFYRLYAGMWSFFCFGDLVRIVYALGVSLVIFVAFVFLMFDFSFVWYPRSVFVVYLLLMGAWMTGARLAMRWLRERRTFKSPTAAIAERRTLVVGGLDEAEQAIRGLEGESGDAFVGVVTDEASAYYLTVRGVNVYGPVSDIGLIAKRTQAQSLLILPPHTRPKVMNDILENCEREGVVCALRMIPSLTDMASGRVALSSIRKVEIEDLLGRPELSFNRQSVRELIADRVVMITGAGGSIGSELARQVTHYQPRQLILFDLSEFNLYSIDMELRTRCPDLSIRSIAGDVGNSILMKDVLTRHRVQLVFHAAAYKHVPIMEENEGMCLWNNTLGTARLLAQAEQAGVERVVLISSDKAVRPTSVMGASKRLAERVVLERPASSLCSVVVRFGNVLGSSGSVIPLFRRQIEEGGPVTVTSPRMTRFFMSIPEAVDLVLQAGAIGRDRDVLVLEMGEAVKIVEMAKRLIELSGLKVGEDIDIVFTGVRPGEKEYEELMTDNEDVVRTPYDKIWVMRKTAAETAPCVDLEILRRFIEAGDSTGLRQELVRLIPDAHAVILERKNP